MFVRGSRKLPMVAASRLRLNSTDKKGKNIVKKDRAEKLEEKIQATNEDAIQLIATRNLEKIIAVLTERPKIASHILSLIEMGAYDSIDKVAATTEAEEKLRGSAVKEGHHGYHPDMPAPLLGMVSDSAPQRAEEELRRAVRLHGPHLPGQCSAQQENPGAHQVFPRAVAKVRL